MQTTTITMSYYLTGIKPPFEGGSVKLEAAYITEFFFMENLEDLFITGSITLYDKGGMLEKLPLTGEEGFKVIAEQVIEDPVDEGNSMHINKTFEFDIYDIKIPKIEGPNQTTYKFDLIEKGAFEFMRRAYSKSYNGWAISGIVADICEKQLSLNSDQYEVEETEDAISYIIPYWKPALTLRDLCKKSRSSTKEGGFLFYSNTGDETATQITKNFTSFGTLMKQAVEIEPDKKYYYKKGDINPYYINNFKEVKNPEWVKRSELTNGISGKKYFGLNLNIDRQPIIIEKTYSDFIATAPMLGKYAYFTINMDDTNSDVRLCGQESELIQAQVDNSFRISIEGLNKREVLLNGALTRFAGKVIFIEQTSDNDNELFHIQDTGKWLIKSITHYFLYNDFYQKMIIMKDAYSDSEAQGMLQVG